MVSRFAIPAVVFLEMVAYAPGLYGAATTLRWSLLWVALPLIMACVPSLRRTWIGIAAMLSVVVFGVYVFTSLIWSSFPLDGIYEMFCLITLMACVRLGSSLESTSLLFRGAAFGIGINSAVAIAQYLGYRPVIQLFPSPAGLFMNGNMLAEAATMVLIGCLVYGQRFSAMLVMPSVILPGQRATMIVLAVMAIYWMRKRGWLVSKQIAILAVVSSLIVIAVSLYGMNDPVWMQAFLGKFRAFESFGERWDIWRATVGGFSWFGNGAGSYRGLFPHFAHDLDTMSTWPLHAHNDLLELVFEYGIFAAVPVALGIRCLISESPMRYVVGAFAIFGLVGFPLYMPATCMLAGLAVGACLRCRVHPGISVHARRVRAHDWPARWRNDRGFAPCGDPVPV